MRTLLHLYITLYVPAVLQFYSYPAHQLLRRLQRDCEIWIIDFSTPWDAGDTCTIFLTDHHNAQSRILKTGKIGGRALGPHELCFWTMPISLFSEQKAISGGVFHFPHVKRQTVIRFVK